MKNFLKSSIIISVLLVVLASLCLSQTKNNVLTGKVFDSETKEPIQFATVFLAFTTKGCLTNERGEYSIANISTGNYDIVCSAIGYEKIGMKIDVKENESSKYDFGLKISLIQANEVSISAKQPEDWEDNLLKFTQEFLGESSLTKQCKITNPEVIDFEIKDNKLRASSKKRINIVNNALGYKLTVFIKEFSWDLDFDEGNLAFEPFFEELKTNDSTDVIRWKENRKEAYLGSFRHFLKSCTANLAYEEGFRLWSCEKYKNTFNGRTTLYFPNSFGWQTRAIFDSTLGKILKRKDSNQYIFETENTLAIGYMNNDEDPNYKWYKKRTLGSKEIKSYQTSYLSFLFKTLSFDNQGHITNRAAFNIQFTGYWAWKRVGDLVPNDYEPPIEN